MAAWPAQELTFDEVHAIATRYWHALSGHDFEAVAAMLDDKEIELAGGREAIVRDFRAAVEQGERMKSFPQRERIDEIRRVRAGGDAGPALFFVRTTRSTDSFPRALETPYVYVVSRVPGTDRDQVFDMACLNGEKLARLWPGLDAGAEWDGLYARVGPRAPSSAPDARVYGYAAPSPAQLVAPRADMALALGHVNPIAAELLYAVRGDGYRNLLAGESRYTGRPTAATIALEVQAAKARRTPGGVEPSESAFESTFDPLPAGVESIAVTWSSSRLAGGGLELRVQARFRGQKDEPLGPAFPDVAIDLGQGVPAPVLRWRELASVADASPR